MQYFPQKGISFWFRGYDIDIIIASFINIA